MRLTCFLTVLLCYAGQARAYRASANVLSNSLALTALLRAPSSTAKLVATSYNTLKKLRPRGLGNTGTVVRLGLAMNKWETCEKEKFGLDEAQRRRLCEFIEEEADRFAETLSSSLAGMPLANWPDYMKEYISYKHQLKRPIPEWAKEAQAPRSQNDSGTDRTHEERRKPPRKVVTSFFGSNLFSDGRQKLARQAYQKQGKNAFMPSQQNSQMDLLDEQLSRFLLTSPNAMARSSMLGQKRSSTVQQQVSSSEPIKRNRGKLKALDEFLKGGRL